MLPLGIKDDRATLGGLCYGVIEVLSKGPRCWGLLEIFRAHIVRSVVWDVGSEVRGLEPNFPRSHVLVQVHFRVETIVSQVGSVEVGSFHYCSQKAPISPLKLLEVVWELSDLLLCRFLPLQNELRSLLPVFHRCYSQHSGQYRAA